MYSNWKAISWHEPVFAWIDIYSSSGLAERWKQRPYRRTEKIPWISRNAVPHVDRIETLQSKTRLVELQLFVKRTIDSRNVALPKWKKKEKRRWKKKKERKGEKRRIMVNNLTKAKEMYKIRFATVRRSRQRRRSKSLRNERETKVVRLVRTR